MPDFNTEMTNVPVGQIIGSTMEALIDSQYSASLKSLELFEKVAYDQSTGGTELATADFTFEVLNPDYDPAATNPGEPTTRRTLIVPLATLVDYGNVSIDHADIDFNVQLASTEYTKSEKSTSAEASLDFRARLGWWGNLRISGKVAHQSKTMQGLEVKRTYGLGVKVHVVRDQPPEAIQTLIAMMQSSVQPPTQ